MKSIDIVAREIRQARIERRWRQADLARRLGISQAAISQFERGNTRALSQDTVHRAAEILGVKLLARTEVPIDGTLLKYCEHPHCMANVPYQGPRGSVVRPRMTRAPVDETTYCPDCGDLLMDQCRNEDCGLPASEGSFCSGCGSSYVNQDGAGEDHETTERDRVFDRTRPRIVRTA